MSSKTELQVLIENENIDFDGQLDLHGLETGERLRLINDMFKTLDLMPYVKDEIIKSCTGELENQSEKNRILIRLQHPTASQVKGFHTWKKEGFHVIKGKRAIWIFVPKTQKQKAAEKDKEDEEILKGFLLRPVYAREDVKLFKEKAGE